MTKKELLRELEGHEFYWKDRGVCGCIKGKVIDGGVAIANLRRLPKRYAHSCWLAEVLLYWPDCEDEGAMKKTKKQT